MYNSYYNNRSFKFFFQNYLPLWFSIRSFSLLNIGEFKVMTISVAGMLQAYLYNFSLRHKYFFYVASAAVFYNGVRTVLVLYLTVEGMAMINLIDDILLLYIGCQGGAVGRGSDCQSCGWQIESQLGQIGKKPSASF